MAISDKLNYLLETKQAIKQAIVDKGQEVADTDTFRSYAEKISAIQTGGGENFARYSVTQEINADDTCTLIITEPNGTNEFMVGQIVDGNATIYLTNV